MGREAIWDTHGKSGNVFVNPTASSSALYLQEIKSMEFSNVSEHTFTHIRRMKNGKPNTSSRSEMPIRTVSQKFSHPSVRGDSLNN